MSATYALVIFDLDGTIVNLDIPWGAARREVIKLLQRRGLAFENSNHLSILCESVTSYPEVKAELDNIFLQYETECIETEKYYPFDGYVELIRHIKSHGLLLAIASSNHTETIKTIVEKIGIVSLFDFICGRDVVGRNKPYPDQISMILTHLAVSPEHTLFVGDTEIDGSAARSAGAAFFRVKSGSRHDVKRLRRLISLNAV